MPLRFLTSFGMTSGGLLKLPHKKVKLLHGTMMLTYNGFCLYQDIIRDMETYLFSRLEVDD